MAITRRAFIGALGTATVGLAGCASGARNQSPINQQSAGETKERERATTEALSITESGWSVGHSGYVHCGIALKNPNNNLEADRTEIHITGKSESGSIVFNTSETIAGIFPGETIYCGLQVGNGKKPAKVEFSLGEPKWSKTDPLGDNIFSISNTSEINTSTNGFSFTGELTSNRQIDPSIIHKIALDLITRDSSGAINYGANLYVDVPAQGSPTPFEIDANDVPEHASFEVHARVGL